MNKYIGITVITLFITLSIINTILICNSCDKTEIAILDSRETNKTESTTITITNFKDKQMTPEENKRVRESFNNEIKSLIDKGLMGLMNITTTHETYFNENDKFSYTRVYAPLAEDFEVEVTFKIKRIN